ncbi:MAG TPA: carboxypeptidase-like regulatory domain-containing protein, partial [Planctomycetota bacterium]|nr:carboxypeptidase-like regulatory domain-containing protein [Planctomycetota bacterium]
LLSLEPELDGQAHASAGGPKVAVVSRGLVMPEERQVRFLEPNREPIVGMRVVLDDGSPTLPVATTNARGEVTFSTTLQKGTLYARRDNSFLQRLEVNLVAARVDAILPWNAELTGRVLAGSGDQAGSLAMPDLQLRVDSDVQLWGGEAVPQTVLAHFEHPNYVQVTSDAEGFFRVQNLPQEWSGKLWLPEGVAVQGASRRDEAGRYVYFREPSHHAMVLVQRLPRLVGRLVGLDGLGSPRAQVRCWVDGATDPLVAVTGPAGGFELLLDSDGHLGLRLEAVSADGLQQADLAFAGNEIPSGFALGDVVLASTLRLGFRAIDPKGDPIFGARGLYQGQLLHGTPTDDEGWGEAILPPAAQDCWIVAPGFQPKEISLGGALEKRTVDLLPATELTLQVLDADTLSMPGATLRVSCGERLFAYGEPFQPASLDLQAMTGTFVATGQGRDLPYAEFRANDQGQLRLLGVVAGAPLWVEVVDKLGMPLHQHRVAALSPSEQRTEQVLVPRKLREFHGIVRDRADNVLVGVQVDLVDSEGKQVSAVSGLDGYVHFQDLSGDHYAVRIDKRGFVAQEIPDFALSGRMGSSPETPAAFVLERGADVAVLVVDGDDRPVLGGRVSARRLSDDQAYLAAPEGAADQTLQDLDQGAIELTLKLGGVVYTEVMQAPLERSIEFRVPAHGALEVVWTLPSGLGLDVPLRLRATALGPNGEPLEAREPVLLTIGARTGTSGVSRFEALLPGNYAIDLLQPTAPVESIQGEAQAPATWSPMVGTQTCQIVLGDAVRKNLDASGALRQ